MRRIENRRPVPTMSQQESALKRELGTSMSTALVVGNMIGSGVFLLPASLAAVMVIHGSSSLLAWAFTGVGAMLLAAVFATLGRAYPRTGGPYAYAHHAFGDFVGFLTAWGYWIAAWVGNAAIAIAFTSYLGVFLRPLREQVAGWPNHHVLGALIAITIVWLATAINVVGVRQTGMVQVVTTVLKFIPIALIGIVGLFFIKAANFGTFRIGGWGDMFSGITAAATLTLWAFIGLESATVPAEEVKDPERTIVRSTIWGTLATTVVYVLATIAIVGIIPAATLQSSGAPFADAATKIFGGAGWFGRNAGNLVAIVALISAFGALNGWIMIQGRVPLAAARDGLFPRPFAWLAGKQGTPWFGLVASSVLISGLMVLNYNQGLVTQFTNVILLATLTTLVPYAFAAAAELYLMVVERERFVVKRALAAAIVALLAFVYAFWAMIGSGNRTIAWGFMLLMAGLPIYVWIRWRERRLGASEAPRARRDTPAPADEEAPRGPRPSGTVRSVRREEHLVLVPDRSNGRREKVVR